MSLGLLVIMITAQVQTQVRTSKSPSASLCTLNAPEHSCLHNLCSPSNTRRSPSAAPPAPTVPPLQGPSFPPSSEAKLLLLSLFLQPALLLTNSNPVLVKQLQFPIPNPILTTPKQLTLTLTLNHEVKTLQSTHPLCLSPLIFDCSPRWPRPLRLVSRASLSSF